VVVDLGQKQAVALMCVVAAVLGIVLDLLLEVGTVEMIAEAAAEVAVEAAAEVAVEAAAEVAVGAAAESIAETESCKCKSYWASRHVVPCPRVGHPLEW